MKTLVIGGTGTVGSQVVRELLKQNQSVRVLITSPEKASLLPESVEPVIGNLNLPATLPLAFEGVDRVFLINRQSLTEVAQGAYAVAAAKRAGVRKIVYQSIHNVRTGAHVPHIGTKISLENIIVRSGLDYTFVSPNNFFQNDLWFRNDIVNRGIYPQPIGGIGLNRVDVRDVAEVAAKALISDAYVGMNIPLAGPDALTGEDTARILSSTLGYQVTYGGDDLASWAEDAKGWLIDWWVADWVKMYELFQAKGMVASAEDLALLTQVLGRAPRSYADFVQEHAAYFQREAVPV